MIFSRLVLLNTLKKELRYEKSISKAPPYLSEFIRKHSLLEQTSNDSTNVYIYKQLLPYKLQIEIPYRRPNPIKKKKQYADESSAEEDPEPKNTSFLDSMLKEDVSKFYLTIHTEQNNFLHFECYTYQSDIWLQNFETSKDLPEQVQNLFAKERIRVNYNVLNENLQQSLVDWIKSLGITEEYGKFIELRSLYKEKELYLSWLQSMTKVIEDQGNNN